ncbi:MAG TPA: NUDIX hydrolase [Gaiellaceae bacterium]
MKEAVGHEDVNQLVRAAGGVVMRPAGSGVEILLVHRPRYDDWTLPKGKARLGESYEACALREVEEETSLVCVLREELAVTEYEDAAGRPKRVRYFAMTPRDDDEAAPQNEIDAVCWLNGASAMETLTYARDRDVVARVVAR